MERHYSIMKCQHTEHEFIKKFMLDLREADRRELAAVCNGMFGKEISESVENSEEAYTVIDEEGIPLAIFGIVAVEGREGRMIWCLGTNALDRYKRPFVHESRGIMMHWLARHHVLYNCVGEFNKKSIRWLKWLGAEFSGPFLVGKKNEPFLYFEIKGADTSV